MTTMTRGWVDSAIAVGECRQAGAIFRVEGGSFARERSYDNVVLRFEARGARTCGDGGFELANVHAILVDAEGAVIVRRSHDSYRQNVVGATVTWPVAVSKVMPAGTALAWMDEVSFIAATRFCRLPLVTVSSDRIDFKHAIPAGSLVELIGRVIKVGNTSLKVEVEVYVEGMYCGGREKAITGVFSFVAIGEDQKPVPVLPDLA